MELAIITIKKITEMFLIMMIGMAAFRCRIVDGPANKRMSGLTLNVIAPVTMFMSYQIGFQPERLRGLAITLALSLLSYLWSILLVNLLLPMKKGREGAVAIERIASIYSNSGFIGIPLIGGIFGEEGVFYLTAYITALNLMIWSHGLSLMCGTVQPKAVLKNFIQPATIAISLGILFFLLRIQVPEVVHNTLNMIAGMNTPMAMLVAGCNLAESNLRVALRKPRVYWVVFLKLLLVPLVSALLLSWIPTERIYRMTILAAIACPSGAMGTMFALQYNKDSNYASELFVISTLLSLVTIPAVIFLAEGMI
jgi:predicted permease